MPKEEDKQDEFDAKYTTGMPENVDRIMETPLLSNCTLYKKAEKDTIDKKNILKSKYCYIRLCTGCIMKVKEFDKNL